MTAPLDIVVAALPPAHRRTWAAACVARCLPLLYDQPTVAAWLDRVLEAVDVVAARPSFGPCLLPFSQVGGQHFRQLLHAGAPPRVWYTIRAARRLCIPDASYLPVWALDAAEQAAQAHGDQVEHERIWQRDEALRCYYGRTPIPLHRKEHVNG